MKLTQRDKARHAIASAFGIDEGKVKEEWIDEYLRMRRS